ncbi:response regulator [Bacteriovorax sp. Seq25_V]|uniref:response regulator n=1 Tax=Bacteriovorax sp. Seq25_V TaxID=1201288 RepID=UPI00038A0CC3|nr:response regulator [Bacteriovorax sp. Seq25_V]EQC46039.1 hypothetical protein M900_1711 [Bacteriovorax sp. Seq25_V]
MDRNQEVRIYNFIEDDEFDQLLFKKAIENIHIKKDIKIEYVAHMTTEALLQYGSFENSRSVFIFDISIAGSTSYNFLVENLMVLKEFPVFILTSSDNPADKKRYLELGVVTEFFLKPFFVHDLEQIILRIWELAEADE